MCPGLLLPGARSTSGGGSASTAGQNLLNQASAAKTPASHRFLQAGVSRMTAMRTTGAVLQKRAKYRSVAAVTRTVIRGVPT